MHFLFHTSLQNPLRITNKSGIKEFDNYITADKAEDCNVNKSFNKD